jgi:argininosuccinate synthase
MSKKKKIVLAYSGGLDTSIIVPWLKEHHDCEVHAYCGDIGQGPDELRGLEDKARRSGAVSCRVDDLRRQWLLDYVWPCVRAMAVYEGRYLLGTSMARPILAKGQVDYAKEIGADALAHGCTGKGNDQVRFELAYQALAPDLDVIAPWRSWDIRSREDALDYAAAHGIDVAASRTKIYSRDRNLWHISHEGGALESPGNPPPDDVWTLTVDPRRAPDQPAELTLGFEHGVPTQLNGEALPPETLLERLNQLGGSHGVGRVDICENRLVGMKSRGAYETPGGTVLVEAIRGLEQLVYDRRTLHERQAIGLKFAEIVYDGQWFTPLREALQASIEKMAERMTGEVVVRLHKGSATTVRRRSPNSLFSAAFATFERDEVYNQAHAEGFIRLLSLPARIAAINAQASAAAKPAPKETARR